MFSQTYSHSLSELLYSEERCRTKNGPIWAHNTCSAYREHQNKSPAPLTGWHGSFEFLLMLKKEIKVAINFRLPWHMRDQQVNKIRWLYPVDQAFLHFMTSWVHEHPEKTFKRMYTAVGLPMTGPVWKTLNDLTEEDPPIHTGSWSRILYNP